MKPFHLFFLLIMAGCKAALSPMDFAKYCEDPQNGLVVNQTCGNVQFELKYIPEQLMALHEFHGEIEKNNFDTVLESYQGMRYFNLKLKPVDKKTDVLLLNAKTKDEYFQRIQYFSSLINEDLKLIVGLDTIPCSIHHYERTYHLSPVIELMIGFEDHNKDIKKNLTVIYRDKIFGLDTVIMKIEGEKIADLPALKL